ncbi:MAG: alpha-(1-_6)-mannopyranosyltransferase A [Chloroflexota bacterium]
MIATRPDQSRSAPALVGSRRRRGHGTLRALALLACAGLLMQIGWTIVWTLSYRLTHGNDFTYTLLVTQPWLWERLHDVLMLENSLAYGLELDTGPASLDIVVNSLVMGFAIVGVGYLCAIVLVDVGTAAVRGALAVVIAFELLFQITLFLTPGLFTTDIFSYVMYGHISALYNLNPYIFPPNYFPGNPLLDWIHPIWHDQPSVYGPLWTDIGWLFARVTAPFDGLTLPLGGTAKLQVGLMDQVLAYKVFMNGVQLVNVGLAWWLLGRLMPLRPRARLSAFILFAWNPLMLFDTAGNAHNDALMVTLLLLSVAPLVAAPPKRANAGWLAGTFLVGMSALIKYTTGLVGIFYIVPWARRLPTWRARSIWIGGAIGLIAGATVVLFLPWADFPRALDPLMTAASGKVWMYTNWAPDLVALWVERFVDPASANDPTSMHVTVRTSAKTITRILFAMYLLWEVRRLWQRAGDRSASMVEPVLEASTRAFVVLILLVLTWVLEWYWMWPLALATLLGWRRTLSQVVVGYTLTSLPIFYVHHYWSWHMPDWLVLLYALPPLLIPVTTWTVGRLRRRDRNDQVSGSIRRAPLGAAAE